MMDNSLQAALIGALAVFLPGIATVIVLWGRSSANAKQVGVQRDELVTTLAADWVSMSKETREMKERLVFLEKREITREAAEKKKDAEQVLREAKYNTDVDALNLKLDTSYTEIKGQRELLVTQGELLGRAYKEITHLNEQIKSLVEQKAAATGQPQEKPPEGDKGIQDAAQAAEGVSPP